MSNAFKFVKITREHFLDVLFSAFPKENGEESREKIMGLYLQSLVEEKLISTSAWNALSEREKNSLEFYKFRNNAVFIRNREHLHAAIHIEGVAERFKVDDYELINGLYACYRAVVHNLSNETNDTIRKIGKRQADVLKSVLKKLKVGRVVNLMMNAYCSRRNVIIEKSTMPLNHPIYGIRNFSEIQTRLMELQKRVCNFDRYFGSPSPDYCPRQREGLISYEDAVSRLLSLYDCGSRQNAEDIFDLILHFASENYIFRHDCWRMLSQEEKDSIQIVPFKDIFFVKGTPLSVERGCVIIDDVTHEVEDLNTLKGMYATVLTLKHRANASQLAHLLLGLDGNPPYGDVWRKVDDLLDHYRYGYLVQKMVDAVGEGQDVFLSYSVNNDFDTGTCVRVRVN